MDNKPKGFGFSNEVKGRIDAKYDTKLEVVIVDWIKEMLQIEGPAGIGSKEFKNWLEDGLILCALANRIVPSCGIVPADPTKCSLESMMNSKKNENVAKFLDAAQSYGVKSLDLFQTVDLRLSGNLAQVQTTLNKLGSIYKTKNPEEKNSIGVTIAKENKRNHGIEELREGRAVIGLQMGTNQVASQQGMTPYGLGRQLTQK